MTEQRNFKRYIGCLANSPMAMPTFDDLKSEMDAILGDITADMSAAFEGWFQIEIGDLSQHILL